MDIEAKQNKNTFPDSIYTFKAEELNQIVNELQYIITTGGLTKNASDTTQVLAALRIIFEYMDSTKINDNNGTNIKSQYQRNRDFEAAIAGGLVSLTGVYVPYGGSVLPPGWLWCDGSAISRVDYAELFAIIGTTFGAGDGSTTFNIPDLTGGRFIEGRSSSGTYKNAGLPNIAGIVASEITSNVTSKWGAFKFRNSIGSIGNSGEASQPFMNFNASEGECGTQKLTATNDPRNSNEPSITYANNTYGKSDTVQPKSMTSRWIIRY